MSDPKPQLLDEILDQQVSGWTGGKTGRHLAEGGPVDLPATVQPSGVNPGGWFALLGGLKTAWNAVRAAEHKHGERRFEDQQGLAGAIAEERAGTPEEAVKTKKRLARADTAARWTQWYALQTTLGALAGPIAGGVAAKGSWYLPTASLAYTGYQLVKEALAGRNPTALLKAARARLAAGKEQQAQGQTPAHLAAGGKAPQHKISSYPGIYSEQFGTPSGSEFQFLASQREKNQGWFGPKKGSWEVMFGNIATSGIMGLKATGMEGTGAVRIMRSVRAAVDRFIADKLPGRFHFSASRFEPARVKLYDRVAKQFAAQHGYALKRGWGLANINYSFSKLPGVGGPGAVAAALQGKAKAPGLAGGGSAAAAGFEPQGTDTQAAQVPEGSYVVNRESSDANKGALDALGAGTVPDQPGQVADFTGGAGSAPAQLTPAERVVSPGAVAAHPGLAQHINAAHGALTPRLAAAGGGGVGAIPHLATGGGGAGGESDEERQRRAFEAKMRGDAEAAAEMRRPKMAAWIPPPLATAVPAAPIPSTPLAAATGPVPVKIVGSVPVASSSSPARNPWDNPAFGKSGIASGGAGGGGGGGTRLTDELARMTKGLAGVGNMFKEMSAKAGIAFAVTTAGMGSMLAASSPAAFQTLTLSARLLTTTLGGAFMPMSVQVSKRLQEVALWVRGLDQGLKETVGRWVAFAAAGLGAIAVLGKVGSMAAGLLPVFAGLRTAIAFLAFNPLGALVAGLAAVAAFHPEAFAGIGAAISGAFANVDLSGVISTLAGALASFASAAATILGPALAGLAGIIKGLGAVAGWLGGVFGSTSGQVLAMGAVFVMLVGPARMLATGIMAIGPALASMSTAMATGGGAVGVLKTALVAAIPALLPFAIAGVTAALLGMGGAFGAVASQVEHATRKIGEMKALLDKLQHGGKTTVADVGTALDNEQKKAYSVAKTEAERRAVLEKALAEAEAKKTESGFGKSTPEEIERMGIGAESVLGEEIKARDMGWKEEREASEWGKKQGFNAWSDTDPATARVYRRSQNLSKVMQDAGMNAAEAEKAVSKVTADHGARKILGQSKIGEEDIQKVLGGLKLPAMKDFTDIEVLKKALSGGVEGKETRLDQLKEASRLVGPAYGNQMQAQVFKPEDYRSALEIANLNINPIDREILDIQKEQNQKLKEIWDQGVTDGKSLKDIIEAIKNAGKR